MSFLSLVGIEFKKIKRSKDISNIVCCHDYSLGYHRYLNADYEFPWNAGGGNFS